MPIFAHQGPGNALSNCCVVLSNCRDVDEYAGICVNPPAINDVELVLDSANSVVRINLEEVVSSSFDIW